MPAKDTENNAIKDDETPDLVAEVHPASKDRAEGQPKEIGGRDGPDPTRYGDWEKAGRCIDF
jgi:hypothetical protein